MISKDDFLFKQVLVAFAKEGNKIVTKNDNVAIVNSEGKILHQSTCYRLFAIFIVGNMSITTPLIKHASKYGYSIIFMSSTFRPYAFINNTGEGNILLREKQYTYSELGAGKIIIRNKISNQKVLLSGIRIKGVTQKDAIKTIKSIIGKIDCAQTIQELMGFEGNAAKVYFEAYFDNVVWNGRKPRIKYDMVNTLLDIGYTVLFSYVESILALYGFDLYQGVLHKQFYLRKSLVCDVMEPFRVIVDKTIKTCINLGQFKEADFKVVNKQWVLKVEESPKYTSVFISAILENREDIFMYIQSFYRSYMKGTIDMNCPVWSVKDGIS